MEFMCKVIQSANHMRIVVGGKITADDCIGLIEQVMSDPHRHPDSTALIDLRNATYDFRDKTDVIRIAHALEAFQSLLKNNIAIVAQKCTLFPAEIFCLHIRETTNLGIRVFVDIAAAEAFCREDDGGEARQTPDHRKRITVRKPAEATTRRNEVFA